MILKRITVLFCITLAVGLLTSCGKPKPKEDYVTIERTASGSEIVHVREPQNNNNDMVWYMLWYQMMFPRQETVIRNYYSNPSASWTQNRYEDYQPEPTPTPPTPSYDEQEPSSYTTPSYTPSYNDSFWDSGSDSYGDSFWDSGSDYGSSYDDSFWGGGGSYDTGSSYTDSFWD